MPFVGTHHEIDAHTHLGVCQEQLRLSLPSSLARLVEGIDHLLHVVAIELDDFPSESLVFGTHVAEVHHLIGGTIDLFLVVIENANKVIDLLGTSIHSSFPDLALILLAIAHQHEDKMRVIVEAFGLCGANSHRQALSKRAGGDTHARKSFSCGRVPLKARP